MHRRPLKPQRGGRQKEPDTEENNEYYQFGGPIGAFLTSVCFIGLTFIVVEKIQSAKWQMLRLPEFPGHIGGWLDLGAAAMFLGWLGAQFALYLLPSIAGTIAFSEAPTKDKSLRLAYRLNGFFVFVVNMTCLMVATYAGVPVTMLTQKALQMLTTGVLVFLLLSIVLYLKAMSLRPRDRSPCGQTESAYYNWFIGAELHPRFGFLDLKLIFFRSSFIGWMIFNWVNVVDAYGTGHLTPSLLLVSGLQLVYVLDTFWFEIRMMWLRDITHEALGFNRLSLFLMTPFTSCVQTRYLATTGFTLPWYCLVTIIGVNVTGYWILRASNTEKHTFRTNTRDPAFTNAQILPTGVRGKSLLVSGWWGWSRHPNYFGEIIVSFSFALPTGFGNFMPYLNPLFLVMMLVDREQIDGAKCRQQYGEAWDKYCEKVKYRIIPYVY